jgi:predicted transcriptional regulator
MNIKRIQKSKNYSIISNEILKRKDLSLKAKGLMSLILSFPDSWELSVNGLVAIVKESKNTIYSILKELNGFGYVERNRVIDKSGKVVKWELLVYEKPHTKKPEAKKPDVENCTQLITNSKINTNLIKHNKESFSIEVLELGILNKEEAENFVDYWAEKNKKGKMRWQLQKTWDLNLRMKRWKRTTKTSSRSKIENQMSAHYGALELLNKKYEGTN